MRASTRPALGTFVSIEIVDAGTATADALDRAFEAIEAVDRSMSFHRPDSELSRINRLGHDHAVPLSPSMHRVLRASLALAAASRGAFDPSIGGALVRSGHRPAPDAPQPDEKANWRDIELDDSGRIRLLRPLWLDLGGIAKGYAVDRAIGSLRRAGVRAATVNAGGDLRSFGHEHTVWVRDPAAPSRSMPLVSIRDAAVATSAAYFSRIGQRGDVVDLASRRSRGHRRSVTICAPRAIWADALTKVALIAPDRAPMLLRGLRARGVVLSADGRRTEIA